MKKKMEVSLGVLAKAERILNRTLAYQAAVAVHELKDLLNVDVEELRLVVAPADVDNPGSYRVICTIVSLAIPEPISVDVVVLPEKAIIPAGKRIQATKSRKVG